MNFGSHSNNKENIPRGCLKLNNKIYPVYEGLNTVGRNPEAIINIKNLNISQQHAVITIIDENTHFISDFKSSNGTIVDNEKLNPLKLYKLNNGASIKFADTFCTYKKLERDDSILDTSNTSQNFSESFYSANTQNITLPNSDDTNVNEMPTQLIISNPISINEMPTQVMIPQQLMQPPTLNINEMPTQVYSLDDSKLLSTKDDSSNDSIDFMTMEKTSESQTFTLNNKANSDTEEEATLESTIHPVKLHSNRSILNSDSEATQSNPEITKQNKLNLEETDEESPMSQINPVKIGPKQVIESDTESEFDSNNEEYISLKERRRSRYVISDDSETDIENDDEDKGDATLYNPDIVPSTQEVVQQSKNLDQSSLNSFRLEVSELMDTHLEETIEKDEEMKQKPLTEDTNNEETEGREEKAVTSNVIAEDHIYFHKECSLNEDVLIGDHIYCRSPEEDEAKCTTLPQSLEENIESNTKKSTYEDIEDSKNSMLKTTRNPITLSKESKGGTIEKKTIEDDESTPKLDFGADDETQSIKNDNETDSNTLLTEELAASVSEKEEEKKTGDDVEDPGTSSKEGEGDTLERKTVEHNQSQSIKDNKENGGDSNTLLTVESTAYANEKKEEKKTDEEDLASLKPTAQSTQKETVESKEKRVDDVFDQPNQEIGLDFIGEKKKLSEDDVFLQHTQKMIGGSDKDEIDDDIYIQPTQQINEDVAEKTKPSRKSDDDLYFQATQQMDAAEDTEEKKKSEEKDHEFARPFQRFSSDKASTSRNEEDDADESLYLPPTQALEYLHKDDKPSTSDLAESLNDKNSNSSGVEDQLEMLFYSQSDHKFIATQQLVDVLEEKNEDIIEDSMIEEKVSSVDSIRMILDDFADEKDDKLKEKGKMKLMPENKEKNNNSNKRSANEDSEETLSNKESSVKDTEIEEIVKRTSRREIREKLEVKENNKKKVGRRKNLDEIESTILEIKESQDNFKTTKAPELHKTRNKKGPQTTADEETNNVRTRRKRGILEKDVEVEETRKRTLKTPNSELEKEKKKEEIGNDPKLKNILSSDSETSTADTVEDSKVGTSKDKKGNAKSRKEKQDVQDNKESLNRTSSRKRTIKAANLESGVPEIQNKKKDSREDSVVFDAFENDSQHSSTRSSTRTRQSRASSVASDISDKFLQPSTSATKTPTRKRNVKTTNSDSADEFEAKIPKTDPPAKSKTNVSSTETPTTRNLRRPRKNKIDLDEVISISSTSSHLDEVISVPSSSTISQEPVKKSRRLSANSRALKNEEEKTKTQETKVKGKKLSIQDVPPPGTPERSKRQLKPKVVFTMMDNPDLESLIRRLGGSVVDTVDACTVLVTESVKRSQKLLCAVGQAKPICSPEWLLACKKANCFLEPSDFILIDNEAEKKWEFSLRESLKRSSKTKLLQNYTFQLIVNAAADVLKGAIEACGGKCVIRNLAKSDTDHIMIVSSKENKSKYSKIVKQNDQIKVVEAEAIFDGTLRQEFRFNKYLLT